MNTLFRILVILVVASLIGGAIFALVNVAAAASQQSSSHRPEGDRHRPEGGERDGPDGGIFLPFGMIKNLVVISIIAAVYLNAGKWFGKKRTAKQVNA
jgi:hypothetical protein